MDIGKFSVDSSTLNNFAAPVIIFSVLIGILAIWAVWLRGSKDKQEKTITSGMIVVVVGFLSYGLYVCSEHLDKKSTYVTGQIHRLSVDEQKKQTKNHKDMMLLLENAMQISQDKIIVEDEKDYKKVTTDKGVFRLKLKYDDNGYTVGIASLENE